MKMIFKYPIHTDIHHNAVIEVEMPKSAKILDIQIQGSIPVLWAIVNPKKETRKYIFHVFGTGFEMSEYEKKHYEYRKTVQMGHLNSMVWHIFEVHE